MFKPRKQTHKLLPTEALKLDYRYLLNQILFRHDGLYVTREIIEAKNLNLKTLCEKTEEELNDIGIPVYESWILFHLLKDIAYGEYFGQGKSFYPLPRVLNLKEVETLVGSEHLAKIESASIIKSKENGFEISFDMNLIKFKVDFLEIKAD